MLPREKHVELGLCSNFNCEHRSRAALNRIQIHTQLIVSLFMMSGFFFQKDKEMRVRWSPS